MKSPIELEDNSMVYNILRKVCLVMHHRNSKPLEYLSSTQVVNPRINLLVYVC
jgi:hypothetical protein